MASEHWKDGQLHCESGPAIVVSRIGGSLYKEWWLNGQLHRKDGPAVEWDDLIKEWWKNGSRHRLEGINPSIINTFPLIALPKPHLPLAEYPNQEAMSIVEFDNNEIFKLSQWCGSICYKQNDLFNSHGDFGANTNVILVEFGLSEDQIKQIEKSLTVKIENLPEIPEAYFSDPKPNDWEENTDKWKNIFDLLGCYKPDKKQIFLDLHQIIHCADRLDQELKVRRKGSPCAMTLFYMVYLHELGHALHHFLATQFARSPFEPTWQAELIAQRFTRTCIHRFGGRAEDVFVLLSNHSPGIYRLWHTERFKPSSLRECRSIVDKEVSSPSSSAPAPVARIDGKLNESYFENGCVWDWVRWEVQKICKNQSDADLFKNVLEI